VALQRTKALPLAHLRSAGGGICCMRRWAHRTHLAGWLLALAAGACRSSADRRSTPDGSGALSVVDDAGRAVVLAAPARRIVSLAPSITELLFAIGAGDRVVGRTTWCKYPPAATAVPSVGDGLDPNVEAIAAQRPDLVVLYRSALTESATGRLAALGIPTLVLRHDRLLDVGRTARLLGRLTGQSSAGDSLARLIDSTLAVPPPATIPRPRLAFVVWDNPPMTIGGGSFLDELVGLAGGENVFHDIRSASATVSLETIAVRDPDWILILTDSAPGPPAWSTRAEWRVVRAARARHFLYLPAELFGQPSPRTPEAVATLRRLLEAAR